MKTDTNREAITQDYLKKANSSQHICFNCSSTNLAHIGSKKGSYIKKIFEFYRCKNCSLVFTHPILDPSLLYNDLYYRGQGADPLVDYYSEFTDYTKTLRPLEFYDILNWALVGLRASSRSQTLPGDTAHWLDFGCGAGGLLSFLTDQGHSFFREHLNASLALAGFENSVFGDRLRTKGLNVLNNLDQFPDESFDVISCIEVIEHTTTPSALISQLSKKLKPGGVFILTTGNVGSRLARLQNVNFAYFLPEVHTSYYNPKLMTALLENAQLVPFKIQHDKAIEFKVLRNLPQTIRTNPLITKLAKLALTKGVLEYWYEFSKMPLAYKPLSKK